MAAHLVEDADAAGVGDDPVLGLGEHEPGALGGDADVAQQGPLERAADGPALDGDDDRGLDGPQLLDAPLAPGHQLVVGHLDLAAADGADVTARGPGRALAPPDDRPHVRCCPTAR